MVLPSPPGTTNSTANLLFVACPCPWSAFCSLARMNTQLNRKPLTTKKPDKTTKPVVMQHIEFTLCPQILLSLNPFRTFKHTGLPILQSRSPQSH